MMKPAELYLDRFCGREIHPVTKATWNLYPDNSLGMMNLCLVIEAGLGILLHEDTEFLHAEPHWEVNIMEKGITVGSLIPGSRFEVPLTYDKTRNGYVTNFYYCEHEGSDNNQVEVLEVQGDRLFIQMTGETIDMNFYDGSKSPTKLLVRTWFNYDASTSRSMQ